MKKINTHQIIELIIKDNLSKKNHKYYSEIFPKLTETQIVKMLSKFKSRYEIAFYMTDININNIEKTPFAKNNRERLKSYSSMIKFFLTYSAFEAFGELFNIGDNTDKVRDFYKLLNESDFKGFIKSMGNGLNLISDYLIKSVDDKKLSKRIKIFQGIEEDDKDIRKIKNNLFQIFPKQKSLKNKDILCLPKAMRHQIAHGKFVATYTSQKDKTHLSATDMISIYNTFNKLLLKLVDKKLNKIYSE